MAYIRDNSNEFSLPFCQNYVGNENTVGNKSINSLRKNCKEKNGCLDRNFPNKKISGGNFNKKEIDKKIFNIRKMSTWDSKNGFKEDLMGFQHIETQKTIIRKNQRRYALLLFICGLLSIGIVIADTQISGSLKVQRDNYKKALHNLTMLNMSKELLSEEYSQIQLFSILEKFSKSFLSVLSLALCIILYYYYRNLLGLQIIRNYLPRGISLVRATPLFKRFFIECLVCIFHIPPFVSDYVSIPFQLQLFAFIRLYHIARYLKERHELMNSQATRFLASVTKTELTSMFLFKTFFMQYPFQLILLAYIILLFIGGYAVCLIESRYTYLDTVWMIIITMTTVGFGDLTPKTMMGRLCIGLAAIIGIFLMALFISLVNETLMLHRREKRILSYVENQEKRLDKKAKVNFKIYDVTDWTTSNCNMHIAHYPKSKDNQAIKFDVSRHKKTCALNVISCWYKYYSYVNKFLRPPDPHTHYLIVNQEGNHTNHFFRKVYAKILESKMLKAMNVWRKTKESQPSGYFAQEFMIEDMKIMMTDLNNKVDGMEKNIENITNLFKNQHERKSKNKQSNDDIIEKIHYEKINGIIPKDHRWNCTDFFEASRIPIDNSLAHESCGIVENPWQNSFDKFDNCKSVHSNKESDNITKKICYTLPKNGDNNSYNEHKRSLHKSESQIAFHLLQNQAKIMHSTLDDIYSKAKQDICDMENIIKSLLICSDKENDSDHCGGFEDNMPIKT